MSSKWTFLRCATLFLRVALLLLVLPLLTSPPGVTAQSPNPNQQAARQTAWRWRAWQLLSPAQQAKVDPRILAELRGETLPAHLGGAANQVAQLAPTQPRPQTRFLVYLTEQPTLAQSPTELFASQVAQRNALVQSLLAQTQAQQAPLRNFLADRQASGDVQDYQPFFMVNALAVDGDLDLIVALAQRADVARVVANYPLQLVDGANGASGNNGAAASPQSAAPVAGRAAPTLDESNWNLALVRADRVWTEFNVRGEGAVVAGFDTGVNFRHPALLHSYRGYLGNSRFDHNYNWFEPDGNLYANGDLGPSVSREPITCGTHGTHTLGTMVGDGTVAGTQVGMAPAAKWIALPGICGNTMGGGIRDDIGGIKAFQWLLCPTDLSGALATADCSKAPDVVNNSWGAANPAGETFRPLIQALRAANIAPVFAAGNPHLTNGTIGSPANAPEAITVGATERDDRVATFSGRGPSFYPGEQKPELSAPGVDIKSSVEDSNYGLSSGTSMAAPHVAGLIALLVAADLRDGTRDFSVDELEALLEATAVDLGPTGADDDFGFGRIDAYNAVSRVLNAGDLRGVVRSAQSNQPLGDATITASTAIHAVTQTNAQGAYSLTVPAGSYPLQVHAWGYMTDTFPSQPVLAHTVSVADFALQPLPQGTVQGTVRSTGGAVAGARLYVAEASSVQTFTDSAGHYQWSLPRGTHQLVVAGTGYRRTTVTVAVNAGATQTTDIAIEQAPSILLVEADAFRGWFSGWPIAEFFQSALREEGYAYTTWPLQYADRTDTFPRADGSTGYGVPSLATLAQYDLVIWADSACNVGTQGCFTYNGPTALGASAALRHYMDQGGRLILSGQDLGFWEDGAPLFTDYLHAALVADRMAGTGSTLTGHGFLSGLQITLTNASLYGYANGALQLAPDAVVAEGAAAAVYPALTYDDGQLPAALAVDPCEADYRALYFAMGYENIGVRGQWRDRAAATALGRSIAWVMGQRQANDVELVVDKVLRFGEPGSSVTYGIQLINTGRQPLKVHLDAGGNQWPIRLQVDGATLPAQLDLLPCATVPVAATVTVPSSAVRDAHDQVALTLTAAESTATPLPALTRTARLTTTVFANWQTAPAMPTPRHGQAAVALPGVPGQRGAQLYTMGGWADALVSGNGSPVAMSTNERFDSCTGQWAMLAALPAPRADAAIAAVNDDLYLIGGSTPVIGSSGSTMQPFANLWRYAVAADRWTELAPLPVAVSGATAIGVGTSIYLFGGVDSTGALRNLSYRYDVATDHWQELAPIPGPGRTHAAVAQLGEELLLIGGYPALNLVARYDLQQNRWQEGPPLHQGRHSFGLAQTPAGELYVIGGAVGDGGIGTVERLVAGANPAQGMWQLMPELQVVYREGATAAYLDGQLLVVGGAGSQGASERLAIDHTFCRSTLSTAQTVVGAGKPLRYAIQVWGDAVALPAVYLHNQLPPNTRFVRFEENALNARYDGATHAIEWQGALGAHAAPPAIRYLLQAEEPEVATSDYLTNTIVFGQGARLAFTQTITSALLSTALADSFKTVDQPRARSGDILTYTIAVQGESYISNTVTVRDPLPPQVTYVPDSLSYRGGRGGYDATTRTIWWEGSTVSAAAPFANLQDRYLTGDSVGRGEFTVPYQWVEIGATGTAVGNGDDVYFCDLPIGFPFPFYGQTEQNFCVSTNGFLSFDALGDAGYNIPACPLPLRAGNQSMIAALWADLIVNDGIYYQTFGSAPQRYLVVQWQGARRFGSFTNQTANFQVVLHEDGFIQVAIADAGDLRGLQSITAVADQSRTAATTYACKEPATLQDQQGVAFLPPGHTFGVAQNTLQFQARINNGLGINLPLTNTAYISATAPPVAEGVLQRHATTIINPLDLSPTRFSADRNELVPQSAALFQMHLSNSGLVSATAAALVITLPEPLTYVADSLFCSVGTCTTVGNTIEWRGVVAPQEETIVRFSAQLTRGLPDRTPLTVMAQVADGFGATYPRPITLLARRSDLRQSQLTFMPQVGEPGATTTLVALLQNVGTVATTGQATITLPAQLEVVVDSLRCGSGRCVLDGNVVYWQGAVAARELISIQVRMRVPTTAHYGDRYIARLALEDIDWTETLSDEAEYKVLHTYLLPLVLGGEARHRLYLPVVAMAR